MNDLTEMTQLFDTHADSSQWIASVVPGATPESAMGSLLTAHIIACAMEVREKISEGFRQEARIGPTLLQHCMNDQVRLRVVVLHDGFEESFSIQIVASNRSQ